MERLREGFHQKYKINQQDVFSWCIQGSLKLDVIVTNTHTEQLARSIAFECLSQSYCKGSS